MQAAPRVGLGQQVAVPLTLGDRYRLGITADPLVPQGVQARSVDIHPGERVLDVAAGSGNAALAAARRGADVIATDFVARLGPAAGAGPRPTTWGTPERIRELFGDRLRDIRFRVRSTDLCGPSAAERVEFNRRHMGPTRAAFARLDAAAQEQLAAALAADLERFNRATDGTLVAPSEYLEVVGERA